MFNLHKWLPCFAAAASRRQLSSILNTTHQRHFLLPECVPQNNGSRRHYPLQGTKPKTRWFFDFNHLNELTGGEYTHDPLRLRRLGGRNPETGMKEDKRIGGGVKFDYFMLDLHRRGPNHPTMTYDERVIEIRRDPNRTPFIALVAGTKGKRWIYATANMEAGQIIKTSGYIPEQPIAGVEGYAYPIGALLEGTLINSLELLPSLKGHVCITEAGSSAEIVRHQGRYTVVRMANKHEYALMRKCMATVGQLSHADYADKIYGSPQMHRRFGFRMAGGPRIRKDGSLGRKINPLPPVRTIKKQTSKRRVPCQWTFTKRQLSGHFGPAASHKLVAEFNNVVRL